MLLILSILLIGGDIHSNPGPIWIMDHGDPCLVFITATLTYSRTFNRMPSQSPWSLLFSYSISYHLSSSCSCKDPPSLRKAAAVSQLSAPHTATSLP